MRSAEIALRSTAAPELGDAYVAGGLVDEMLGARAGVAYVY